MSLPVGLDDVRSAAERIGPHVVLTPCTRTSAFRDLVGADLDFKLENLQRTGSFKDRGSLHRLLGLAPEERAAGVITASAGNHGQAVAFHAQRLGISCTVVMPETAPLIKVSNTSGFGARVLQEGSVLDDAAVRVRELAEAEGMIPIPAFDDPHVISGQGTMGLELDAQVPDLGTIVVPVGGGGMIAGIAVALRALRPGVRIIGVEAEAAPSARASRDAGRVVKIESAHTLADGIATKRVGDLTFPIIEELVDDLVVVGEEEIASAILLLLERQKTVVEGAGATPLAALLSGKVSVATSGSTVLVLSGGNIDVNMVSRIIDRGLVADGRLADLTVTMPDRPGSVACLTRLVADLGANVLEISHARAFADISVGDVEIVCRLETRGRQHVDQIETALEAEGLRVERGIGSGSDT